MTYEAHFKAYRNMLTRVIRAAKLGRKKHKLPSSFMYNNTSINDPQVVTDSSDIQSSYVDYLPPPVPFSFFSKTHHDI